jgi:hypothetical protein
MRDGQRRMWQRRHVSTVSRRRILQWPEPVRCPGLHAENMQRARGAVRPHGEHVRGACPVRRLPTRNGVRRGWRSWAVRQDSVSSAHVQRLGRYLRTGRRRMRGSYTELRNLRGSAFLQEWRVCSGLYASHVCTGGRAMRPDRGRLRGTGRLRPVPSGPRMWLQQPGQSLRIGRPEVELAGRRRPPQ